MEKGPFRVRRQTKSVKPRIVCEQYLNDGIEKTSNAVDVKIAENHFCDSESDQFAQPASDKEVDLEDTVVGSADTSAPEKNAESTQVKESRVLRFLRRGVRRAYSNHIRPNFRENRLLSSPKRILPLKMVKLFYSWKPTKNTEFSVKILQSVLRVSR